MFRSFYSLVFCFLLLSGCNRSDDRQFLVTRIKSAAKLATMEVVLSKIVAFNVSQRRAALIFKRADKMVAFNTEATVKFGVDLSKITNNDISTNGDTVSVKLPSVELLSFNYPHEKFIELYPISDFDAIKNDEAKIKQLDEGFRKAELDIRRKIKLLQLEEEAKQKTSAFIEQFLSKTGFNHISISYKE